MHTAARHIAARTVDTSDESSTSWTRTIYGARFYFERYEPFTNADGEPVSGYISVWRFNEAMDFYDLVHAWTVHAPAELRLIDPNGYTVPDTITTVSTGTADRVRHQLLTEVAPAHAAMWADHGYDARDYRTKESPCTPDHSPAAHEGAAP